MCVQTYGVFKCTGWQKRTDLLPNIDTLRRKCWCKQRLLETADSNSKRPRNWVPSTNYGQCTPCRTERKRDELPVAGVYWDEGFKTKSNGMRFHTVLSLSKWTQEIRILQNILQTNTDIIQIVDVLRTSGLSAKLVLSSLKVAILYFKGEFRVPLKLQN
jgi:hypothetical protein